MNTMRERFDEKYKESVLKAYSESQESHIILLADIADFIEQEIKKEREEIVEMVSKEFDRQLESCTKFGHEPILYLPDTKRIIINTIKKRYD